MKYAFRSLVERGDFVLVKKKAIQAHYTEIQRNRASRSAKLRVIQKI